MRPIQLDLFGGEGQPLSSEIAGDGWSTIRVPGRLAERIEALCEAETRRYVEGRTSRVFVSDKTGGVPVWAVIERAIDELDDKRRRSNRKRGVK